MKRYLLLIVLVLMEVVSYSKEVPLERASEQALQFFGCQVKSTDAVRLLWDGIGSDTKSVSEAPAFYVFGPAEGPGFVIISGEDSLPPVLAWSDKNDFSSDDIPDNALWWFEYISSLVSSARRTAAAPSYASIDKDDVVLLIETASWDQKEPYNNQCPMYEPMNKRSVTGCVATAMAIIMRDRQWPDAGVGIIPAYETTLGVTVSERKLGEPYDWENLTLSHAVSSSWSLEQEERVARVMADCGAAIQAKYRYPETTASEYMAVQAMIEYMKYDPGAYLVQKAYYNDDEWCKLLKSQLSINGPVLYTANNAKGGHAFIIDGYTVNDAFHVNWGWGGSCNGYFLLSGMKPSDSDSPYNEDHDMVLDLVPFKGGNPREVILFYSTMVDDTYLSGLTVEETDPVSGLPSLITLGGFWNKGSMPYSGKFRLGVFDREYNLIKDLWSHEIKDFQLDPSSWVYFEDIPIEIGEIDFGYRLVAQFYNNGSGEWEKVRASSDYDGISEILLADEYSLEESTSVSYHADEDVVIISVKDGVTVRCVDENGQEVKLNTEQDGMYKIYASELGDGVYTVSLSKGSEFAEVEFVTGG